MAGLKFDITGDNSNIVSSLHETQEGVRQTQKIIEQSGQSIDQTFDKMGASASNAASAIGKTTEAVSKHSEAVKNNAELQIIASQSTKELKNNLKLYEKAIEDIKAALNDTDYDSKIKKATESIEKQKEKIEKYKESLSNLSPADKATDQGLNYYNNRIKEAQSKIDSLTVSVKQWKLVQGRLNSDMEYYTKLADAANARLNGLHKQETPVDNSSKKQSLAELNASLDESQEKLHQLEAAAEKLNKTPFLSSNQKEKLIDLNLEIEKTKEQIKSLKEQITSQITEQRGGTFFGTIRNAIDDFGNKISETKEKVKDFVAEHTRLNKLKDKIGNNPGVQRFQAEYTQAKGIVSDFSNRVELLLTGNGKLQQSFSAMGTAINGMGLPLKGVGAGIVNVTKALWAMCATPIGAVITVIVTGLAAMHKYLTKSAEGQRTLAQISAFLGSLLSSITDIVVILGKYLFHAFSDANGPMHAFAKSMAATFTSAIKTVGELVGGLGTALKGVFNLDWKTFSSGMSKIWQGVKDGGKTVINAIDTQIKGVFGSFKMIKNVFTDNSLGKEFGAKFGNVISDATKAAEFAKRTTEATIAAVNAQKQVAELDLQIAENREKIYKLTGKAKDALIEETKILQKKRYDAILDVQKTQLDIQREKNRLHTASLEDLAKERQLHIDVLRTTAEQASSTRMLTRMQESNRRKMRTEEASSRKRKESAAKIALNKSNAVTSTEEKFDETVFSNFYERKKVITDLEQKLTRAKIAAMKDGAERVAAEREQQNLDELNDIEKQRDKAIEAERKRQKAEFDAEQAIIKARGGKVTAWDNNMFDSNNEDVKQINSLFDDLKDEAIKKFIRENFEEQRNAFNEYLKEYGTFEEKKLAITQEYEERIRKASSVGEKSSLEMQRNKEIENLRSDDLKKSINWNGVFSNLQGHTKQYLQGLRDQLQSLLDSGNLPIDQMSVISDKINAIDDELGKQQGIWGYVGEKAREHNRLLKEAADAQERLNAARSEEAGAKVNLGFAKMDVQKYLSDAGVDMNIADISTANLNGKIDLTDDKFKGMVPLLQRLAVAEGKLTDARKKTIKATNEARQAGDKAEINPAQKIADWFYDKQKFIKDKGIDQLPDLLGSVGLSDAGNKIGKGLAGFNSAAGAAADFATGNYIGAAIKAIDAVSNFGSAIFGDGNVDSLEKRIEDLGKSNEILAKSIDSLAQNINKKDATNEQSIDAYKKALAAQKEIEANQREQIRARASEWSKKHSFNYYANKKGTDWFGWRDFNKVLSEHGHDKKIMSIDDLWQLSPEMMKLLRDNAYSAWSDLLNNTKGQANPSGLINEYINNAGKKEELTSSLNEKLTGYSWDGFLNSYKSLLKNLESTTEDFADNINEMISNALIESFVNEELQPKIKELYDYISNASKDGLSEDEINEIRKRNDDIAKIGTERRDILEQAGMISQKNASQKASANGVSSITFEQANNIVALTTAGNISRDQIKDLVTSVMASISAIMAFSSSTNTAVLEIRNLMIYNNSYLEDILKCSKSIYADFSRKIDDVNKNLKDLK